MFHRHKGSTQYQPPHDKTNKMTVRRAKTHQWVAFFMQIKKTDQTGRMLRLIWVFDGSTYHSVGFVMRWLVWIFLSLLSVVANFELFFLTIDENIKITCKNSHFKHYFLKQIKDFAMGLEDLNDCYTLLLMMRKMKTNWALSRESLWPEKTKTGLLSYRS